MTMMLGVQGADWLTRHLRLSDMLAVAKGPMDAGKALLEVEATLEAAGKLRPEWKLHWQAPWRARLAHCYDMRDALMCAASLEVSRRIPTPALSCSGLPLSLSVCVCVCVCVWLLHPR